MNRNRPGEGVGATRLPLAGGDESVDEPHLCKRHLVCPSPEGI